MLTSRFLCKQITERIADNPVTSSQVSMANTLENTEWTLITVEDPIFPAPDLKLW